jgi:ABC-type sugar transport system ATPase subunit
MNAPASFLKVENLSKSYVGVQALKGVGFEVQAGQVHAIVGENGAGKSTLIKILSGAERPDTGHIWLDGKPYRPHSPRDSRRANVSTIYQVFNLLPDRTIMHNILLGKEIRQGGIFLDLAAMRSETRRILDTLDAAHLQPDMIVGELKVGDKQIVEIAKALLNQSKLLIMDEPTSALNQTEANALFNVIKRLKDQGVTILYVSHRLEEIFQLADAVTVLRDGGHISTHSINEVTRDSLVEDMIGRKLSGVFPSRKPTNNEEILEVENLSVHRLLHNISFSLRRGEVLAIAGLSGSGKTELGKALFGDLPIQGGNIRIKGQSYRPVPWRAIHNKMIYLPEDRKSDGVIQELSIKRNISLANLQTITSLFGFILGGKEQQIAAKQIIALEIKTPHMNQLVANLSGGNQQKVALAKCLAVDPDIFILMEPTQGIDVGVKFEVYQFIAEQAAQGRSILLISSELAEVIGLAHRILVMHEGRIAAELDAAQTNQEEILRYALGQDSPSAESEKKV